MQGETKNPLASKRQHMTLTQQNNVSNRETKSRAHRSIYDRRNVKFLFRGRFLFLSFLSKKNRKLTHTGCKQNIKGLFLYTCVIKLAPVRDVYGQPADP